MLRKGFLVQRGYKEEAWKLRLSGKYGGTLGALIFFCFLFFYQGKKRERRVKAKATLIKMNAGTSPCITLPPHFGIQ